MTPNEKNDLLRAKGLFKRHYGESPTHYLISYGRLELLGNHTDHQHGKCLVATCSLGIKSAVKPSEDVQIKSEGYGAFSFSVEDLSMKEKEKGTSIGLTRGVLSYLKEHGYKVGGFKAANNSDIYSGAGVSSSAAFELLIGETINALYNDGKIPRIVLAKAGQYAENVYFGKASGLLDQCGSAFGGVCYLDFSNIADPKVEPLPFPAWPLKIYLVNPGKSHAGLSDLYSAMPNDMKKVARSYGKEVLGEVDPLSFYETIYRKKDLLPIERERALHFMGENARVERGLAALQEGNLRAFLELERETELSQETLLHNVMVGDEYDGSPLEAVHRAECFLKEGSARVMGGGLVGSILCLVPEKEERLFLAGMGQFYPKGAIAEVYIPAVGAHLEKNL